MKLSHILLEASGFDKENVLYHGSNEQFDALDRAYSRTADYIYTTPDPVTASGYGKYVYKIAPRIKKMADLIDDHSTITRVAKELAPELEFDVKGQYRSLKSVLQDGSLSDTIKNSANKLNAFLINKAKQALATDDSLDDMDDAIYDVEQYDDEFEKHWDSLISEIAFHKCVELIQSGQTYDYDYKGKMQDRIMDTCFNLGYNCVRFIDPAPMMGEPESIVFEDGVDLLILEKLNRSEI